MISSIKRNNLQILCEQIVYRNIFVWKGNRGQNNKKDCGKICVEKEAVLHQLVKQPDSATLYRSSNYLSTGDTKTAINSGLLTLTERPLTLGR